jgi:effector-binding domain-containing protein
MTYPCELQEQKSQPVLSIRRTTAVGDLPVVLGEAFGKIAQYLGEIGEQPGGPPFAAYHNMDVQNLDVEIGFPVPRVLGGRDDIQAGEIPEGKYAACLYTGPYNKIEPAYNALTTWVEEQGHVAKGVAYEIYLNDPAETPEEALMTQILFPLE